MRLLVILAILLLGGSIAMSQPTPAEVQAQIDDLKKQKELLDAEKARLEAEKAKIEAAKLLIAAQLPEDANLTAAQKDAAAAKAQKDLLDAQKNLLEAQRALEKAQQPLDSRLDDLKNQKALADAQKDLANSETDALKAQLFGTVIGGPFSGSVDLKEKAGIAEANLLAARAIRSAAVPIAEQVKAALKRAPQANSDGEAKAGASLFLFAVKEFPSFQRLLAFRFRKELVKQAFQNARIEVDSLTSNKSPTPAMISAGLDAFSKILGFFKTDFTVGGIEVKPDETQLLFSVAGKLIDQNVQMPALYNPLAQANAVADLARELNELVLLRAKADSEMKALQEQIDSLEKGTDDEKKTAAKLKPRVVQLTGVISLYDTFASSLTTPDANGSLPLAVLAQEFSIDKVLQDNGNVLLVKLENAGGGYFVKKNLFTGLGFMPLYHMGGATASYVLIAGKSGKLLASNVVPVHGGFVKAGKVETRLTEEPR